MSGRHDVHFSSAKHDWRTPADLFAKLDAIYRFDTDAAASRDNALCSDWWGVDDNGLVQDWAGRRVWVNPPYGRQLGLWTRKAAAEAKAATLIVMLVPARTDTIWWHDAIKTARPVFLRGRLRFGGATAGAPFPSALLLWGCP